MRLTPIGAALVPFVVALGLGASRLKAANEPRTWPARDDEVAEIERIFGESERLEAQIKDERAKLQGRFDGSIAYAKGRRSLPQSLGLTYERVPRRWVEVAPVSSAK